MDTPVAFFTPHPHVTMKAKVVIFAVVLQEAGYSSGLRVLLS